MIEPTKLRVIELRRELRDRNLDTNGKKIELISRLQFALDGEHRQLQSIDINSVEQVESENISSHEISSANISIQTGSVTTANAIVSSHSDEIVTTIDSIRSIERNSTEIREADSSISENNDENRGSGQNEVIVDLKEVTYTLMPGKRTNSEILYSKEEQQFYVKKKKLANGVISLVCRADGCNNHCYLDLQRNICSLPVPYVPHNHATKEEQFKRLCVLNKIKSDCSNPNTVAKTETKTSVVKSIFKDTIAKNEDSTIQYHRVERTLRRIASKTMPPAPKTIDQIGSTFANEHVNRLYGQTSHKSDTEKNQFYRTTHVSDEFAYSVFASQRCIELIEAHYPVNERRYTMDATFKIVPRLFYQLLIIYFETPTKQVQFSFLNITKLILMISFVFFFCDNRHFHSFSC